MKQTYSLAINGIFIALVLLLGLTPLGLIPLGFVNLTILHIPVIIGTILLGIKTGLILGLCFGTVSLMSLLGLSLAPASALGLNLLSANPFYAVAMCILPRLLVPVVTHLVYRAIARGRGQHLRAVPFAALAGSVTNTVFYLGLMYGFYALAGLDLAALAQRLGVAGLSFFGIILAIATGGGGAEAVAAAILSPPIAAAIWKTKSDTKGSSA
jgi:uncharacterized membrane protein